MHSPYHQNRRNGTPMPHLRLSDSIFRIFIRCLFDWCIIQVKHLVRRHRKIKERRQMTRMKHSPCHQNRHNGTPTPHLRLSDNIFLIFIRSLFDWCIIQVKHLVRRHRKKKKWRHNHRCGDSPYGKEKSSLSTSVEDIRFSRVPLSSLLNSWQDDIKFINTCNVCMAKNGIQRVCLASWRRGRKKVVVLMTGLFDPSLILDRFDSNVFFVYQSHERC